MKRDTKIIRSKRICPKGCSRNSYFVYWQCYDFVQKRFSTHGTPRLLVLNDRSLHSIKCDINEEIILETSRIQ